MQTIRQLRQERGWTQEKLARRLGVGQGTVSAWERGRAMPRPRTLQHLADLFYLDVEAIAVGPAEQAPEDFAWRVSDDTVYTSAALVEHCLALLTTQMGATAGASSTAGGALVRAPGSRARPARR